MTESAAREAMQVDAGRSSLIAGLSHALHIQLQAISAAGSALGGLRPDDCTLRDATSILARAAQRMHGLHADLLDLIRLEADDLQLEYGGTTVQWLAERALRTHLAAIEHRRLRIVCSMPARDVHVRCDVERMQRALEHLLAHAIGETPRGGEILVRCTNTGHQVELEIADAGPSFAEEAHSILVEPRLRMHCVDTLHADLQLARLLVEAHAGQIVHDDSMPARRSRYMLIAPR